MRVARRRWAGRWLSAKDGVLLLLVAYPMRSIVGTGESCLEGTEGIMTELAPVVLVKDGPLGSSIRPEPGSRKTELTVSVHGCERCDENYRW